MVDSQRLGITARFQVSVGEINLGNWKSCKGLSVQFESNPMYAGGLYEAPVALLAEKLKYNNITLQRAMDPVSSAAVQQWLSRRKRTWMNCYWDPADHPDHGETAVITLLDSALNEVIHWSLTGVYPARWAGPDLDSGQAAIATETLELVHLGFL